MPARRLGPRSGPTVQGGGERFQGRRWKNWRQSEELENRENQTPNGSAWTPSHADFRIDQHGSEGTRRPTNALSNKSSSSPDSSTISRFFHCLRLSFIVPGLRSEMQFLTRAEISGG